LENRNIPDWIILSSSSIESVKSVRIRALNFIIVDHCSLKRKLKIRNATILNFRVYASQVFKINGGIGAR